MRIPNHDRAFVPPEKLQLYLLNEAHPSGGYKAVLLRAFGYTLSNWETLATDLLEIAATRDIVSKEEHEHGVNYAVDGVLQTPVRRELPVRTVWFVRRGAETASFVTAYPV